MDSDLRDRSFVTRSSRNTFYLSSAGRCRHRPKKPFNPIAREMRSGLTVALSYKESDVRVPGYPYVSKGEGLIQTYDLLDHLVVDVDTAFGTLEIDKLSYYVRRCAARAVFAFVEGIVQIVKSEINSDLRMGRYSIGLSTKEQEVLYEKRMMNGESVPIRIPIDENLTRTFRLAAKLWNLSRYELETDGLAYQDFLRAKEARNRLTHPRTYYDIEVADADMHCYAAAFIWSRRAFTTLFRMKVESIAADLSPEVRDQLLARDPNNSPEGDAAKPRASG